MVNLEVQELLLQGKTLMSQENYENAIRYFIDAEKADRYNMEVYINQGISYANMERYTEAKDAFLKALKINKKEAVIYFHLGNIELLLGNMNDGITYYNNAIAYGYDNAQIYYSMGLMYEEQGNDDLALRNYSKAIIKDPLRADIRIRKAKLFIKNNHLNEALQTLDELILSNPDVFEGYHLKFLVLVSLGKNQEAETVIEEAIKLFPSDTGFALDKASLMITKGEYDEALAFIDNIEQNMEIDTFEKHSIAMEKARIYAFQTDMDKTIESLIQAKDIFNGLENPIVDTEAIYLLMNCYVNKESYQEVINCAKELKTTEEDYYHLAAYFYEPLALKKLERFDEADKLFREGIGFLRNVSLQNPGNIDSYVFRIMCHRELKEYEKAYDLAKYLGLVKDDSAEVHTLLAMTLEDLGKIDESKQERSKAATLGGNAPTDEKS